MLYFGFAGYILSYISWIKRNLFAPLPPEVLNLCFEITNHPKTIETRIQSTTCFFN